jgi:DNA invertase Pin-like site-specific DNA recombinase
VNAQPIETIHKIENQKLLSGSPSLTCKNQDIRKGAIPPTKQRREMPMRIIGYARVSTMGQRLDAQLEQLRMAGCVAIFREKMSGATNDRPELQHLLHSITKGDVVIVTRLDRLARSTRDLLNTINALSERGASFRSLADSWADTTTPQGRLVLTVLGGLAEYERELIRSRTMEGRARAVAQGVRLGRTPKLSAGQKEQAIRRRKAGERLATIARCFRVSTTTISRLSASDKGRSK